MVENVSGERGVPLTRTGSQASPEAPADLRPQGVDPSRDPNPAVILAYPQPVCVDYVNWRGEHARRRILPTGRIVFGATEWHPRHQWLLEALDLDKSAVRLFAFEDLQMLRPPAPAMSPREGGDAVAAPGRSPASAVANGEAPSGYVLAPVEPTEAMWGGLARQIVMWSRSARPTGTTLFRDLRNCGWTIPDWLPAEIEDADYVPPKGAVAVAIYRAMIAALSRPRTDGDER